MIFIGMETSGQLRLRFMGRGKVAWSCDRLPAVGSDIGHFIGDVFECLDCWIGKGMIPEAAIFHPDCTYLTTSAAWAFNDPDFERYPGVGYHQKVKPGTLTGAARRAAREKALDDVRRIIALPIPLKIIENPIGAISKAIAKPCDIVQPYEFGDDASKATCLWAFDRGGKKIDFKLPRDPAKRVRGRMVAVTESGSDLFSDTGIVTYRECWANQTDTGQNRLSPADDRWSARSRTYDGIADALVSEILKLI